MSKNGKLKKAQNVEKRRLQMQEAVECLPLKQAAEEEVECLPLKLAAEEEVMVARKKPKQCSFPHCRQYVDPSCTVCPYCGTRLS